MNERIKLLALQAGYTTLPGFDFANELQEVFLEKFAKAIVKECLSIVNVAERGGNNEVWDNAVKFIRRDLQEHFGVEE